MQLFDFISAKIAAISANFQHPVFLWGIPILFVVLLVLVTKNMVRYSLDDEGQRRLLRMRIFVFIARFLSMSVLCLALATPFTELAQESEGNPRALVLVDKSGSMQAYDTSFVPELTKEISKELPTSVKEFGSTTQSPVGDALLGQDEHVLLISDGNANTGVELLDVAQVARENNLSINTIKLTATQHDAAVFIDAPQKFPVGYPANIRIEVTSTDTKPVPLSVVVDGKQVVSQEILGSIEINPPLGTGYHKIEAHIPTDGNKENNDFYSVVEVLEKPKVLVIAKAQGDLERAMAGLFDITVSNRVPDISQLQQYYAIVIDDTPANSIGNVEDIAEFLRDEQGGKYGGGLVVIGGFNSFDRGGYGGSQLETLLPIKVGKAKRTMGENNIVFVLQVSGSTGAVRYVQEGGKLKEVVDTEPTIDIIKAQAVSAINSLNLKNNVGVVVFGVSTAGESYGSAEEALQKSVVTISDIKPLYTNKQELIEKIPRINGGGTTAPDIALKTAVEMLKDKSGDKTIIFLTNGRFSAGLGAGDSVPAKANTLAVVENARKRYNVKTQTIGVGSADEKIFANKVDESFLKGVAATGDSTYDRGTNLASLIIKYGDPKEKGFGENFNLVPLSLTHFITRDLEMTAVLNGYNEVVPKDGSRMLVSTDAGNPAVVVWNYFNGRVATITAFSANGLGPLLQGNNSDLVRNTILWAIGDPGRKDEIKVETKPAIVNQKSEITFVSKQPITGSCPDTKLAFDRSSGDIYIFTFTPTKAGFSTACSVPYAVNGESEYWRVGESQQLQTAVGVTEGGSFTQDQIDEIVEQIKTVSTRITIEKRDIRNPLIFAAICVFLLEIFIRRFLQYKKS